MFLFAIVYKSLYVFSCLCVCLWQFLFVFPLLFKLIWWLKVKENYASFMWPKFIRLWMICILISIQVLDPATLHENIYIQPVHSVDQNKYTRWNYENRINAVSSTFSYLVISHFILRKKWKCSLNFFCHKFLPFMTIHREGVLVKLNAISSHNRIYLL